MLARTHDSRQISAFQRVV